MCQAVQQLGASDKEPHPGYGLFLKVQSRYNTNDYKSQEVNNNALGIYVYAKIHIGYNVTTVGDKTYKFTDIVHVVLTDKLQIPAGSSSNPCWIIFKSLLDHLQIPAGSSCMFISIDLGCETINIICGAHEKKTVFMPPLCILVRLNWVHELWVLAGGQVAPMR